MGGLDLVALLFEQGPPDQASIAAIVDKEDAGGNSSGWDSDGAEAR